MDFLLEIGTEEIPARLLAGLGEDLRGRMSAGLAEVNLPAEDGAELFLTPRRLAVRLSGLPASQEDRLEEVLGPPAKIAFDESGAPTKAASGFARSQGADTEALRRVTTDKGEYAGLTLEVRGRPTSEVLQEVVPAAVEGMHLPVSMRWGRGRGPFVRAVRWLVCLLEGDVLPVALFGVEAGDSTRGHRVLGPGTHEIARPADYEGTLRGAGVEPDPPARRERILEGLARQAGELGAVAADQAFSEKLVANLTMLTEHPVVVRGAFDERFLALPLEVIDTSMRHHQLMFSLRGPEGGLLPAFLTVLNNEDPQGTIAQGQRQVLEARLHDADFFWAKDRERGLTGYCEGLARVVFQERLGSYADKISRMGDTLDALAEPLELEDDGRQAVARAIELCKGDLCSLTVGEFPELQGTAGALLAGDAGEPSAITTPIRHQYAPLACPDDDPDVGGVDLLALLDNLDTLMGCHGVGIKATGSKDPYGLRRAAYTVGRLLADDRMGVDLDLERAVDASRRSLRSVEAFDGDDAAQRTVELVESRLRYHFEEERGYAYDEIDAVFSAGWSRPADAVARLEAVHALRREAALEELAVPLKRIRNILRDAASKGFEPGAFDASRLTEPAAEELAERAERTRNEVEPLLASRSYREALQCMAALRPVVDGFFEEVLVMDEDEEVRSNRLSLLAGVQDLFLRIADIGEIVEGGRSPGNDPRQS